jgi:23S rRNA U2552 (ribose-2'-O)-methylase RlmE/FtsJ
VRVQVSIDLGAAPGAWTEVLAEMTQEVVIAVDPAELSAACLALPNVRHVRCNSRLPECSVLLAYEVSLELSVEWIGHSFGFTKEESLWLEGEWCLLLWFT